MSSTRMLRWALVVSVCIHLALLLVGRGYWSAWLGNEADEEILSARLLPPSAPPAQPKPPPPERPKPKPKATPEAVTPLQPVPGTSEGGAISAAAGIADAPTSNEPARGAGISSRALPGSAQLFFDVLKSEQGFVVGQAVHEWTLDGDRYELRSNIETVGIVALFADVRLGQFSSGRIDADGLHPHAFQDNRKDGSYRSEFDWERMTLRLSNGSVVPLTEGAQDILSMFYQFALYPLDTPELSLMVTTGRKFERYVFRVERDVELWLNRASDDAPIWTYHLSYRGREAEGVDVWLARDMDRLPVKIRYTDRKGGVTEMVARNIDYSGKQ